MGLAVSALCVATAQPGEPAARAFRSDMADFELTEDEGETYAGILDLIPGVKGLIEKLMPLIQQKIDILLDPNMPMNEKVEAIMQVCKDHAGEIVKIVGDFGLKVIIQSILPGIINSMG